MMPSNVTALMKTAVRVATLLPSRQADSSPSVAIFRENVVMNAVESAPSANKEQRLRLYESKNFHSRRSMRFSTQGTAIKVARSCSRPGGAKPEDRSNRPCALLRRQRSRPARCEDSFQSSGSNCDFVRPTFELPWWENLERRRASGKQALQHRRGAKLETCSRHY